MLQFLKRYLAILITFLIISCETEPIIFKGPYYVRFTNESLTKKESFSDIVKIEVHMAGPAPTEDITINYEVSGSARPGIDYSILSDVNKVTIKKGEYFGYIQVKLINNSNNILRSQDIVFNMITISNPKIQIGQGVSQIGKKFTFTIQDDCILAGTYSGVQSTFGVLDSPVEGITITSNDCENYLLSNWNINISTELPYDYSLTFIDVGDNTLKIPEQDVDKKLRGTGVIDPVTHKIYLAISYDDTDQDDKLIVVTINIILTPK